MSARPEIRISPGYQFGRPCIAGTRIPTSSLAENVFAGDHPEWVAENFELTRDEVLLACWYELDLLGENPRGKRDKALVARAGDWTERAFKAFWHGETPPDFPSPELVKLGHHDPAAYLASYGFTRKATP